MELVRAPNFVNAFAYRIISVRFIQFVSCMFRLLHQPIARGSFSRLVVHGAFRLPPRCHFRFRANQRKFTVAYAAKPPMVETGSNELAGASVTTRQSIVFQSPSSRSVSPGTCNHTPIIA